MKFGGHPRIDSLPLLQVVEGDQNRTRAHQRLKTGDLRRPPYLLFGYFMVVILAYSQFPYRTKEQNTIPEEGPPAWSGKYENRPLQRNRKGIRFLMSLAKIKSNMNLLVLSNLRFCVENGSKTMMMMMMMMKHKITIFFLQKPEKPTFAAPCYKHSRNLGNSQLIHMHKQ